MKKRLKIFFILSLFALIGVAILSGLAFYYYSNPSKLKRIVENAVSDYTGTECSVKEISFSQKPLIILARGIELVGRAQGLYLEIPEISLFISIRGGFGRRTLIFEDLQAKGFILNMAERWDLPQIAKGSEKLSFLRRILGGLFKFFLFNDIRLTKLGLTDGHVNGRWGHLTVSVTGIHANLTSERTLKAGCAIRLRSIPDEIDFEIPRLEWITDHPINPDDETIRATLKGEEIAFETSQGKVSSATLETKMLYHRAEKILDFESFTILSDAVMLQLGKETRPSSFPFLLEAKAGISLENTKVAAPFVHVALGGIADFKGEFHGNFTGRQKSSITVAELKIFPEKVLRMFPSLMPESLDAFVSTGSLYISGRVSGNMDQQFGQWDCDLAIRLRENKISFESPVVRIHTSVTGEVKLRGPLSGPELHLDTTLDEGGARIGEIEIDTGKLGLSVTGAYPAFRISELSLQKGAAKWKIKGRPFFLEEIEARTRSGSLDMKRKTLHLPELALSASTLKNLVFSVKMEEKAFSLAARGENVHVVEFGRAMGLIPRGWKMKAQDSLEGRALFREDGRLTFSGRLMVQDLSFESEDGDMAGEKISFVLEPDLEGNLEPEGRLAGAMSLSAGKGEILYDQFYLDLNKQPVTVEGKGDYETALGSLNLTNFGFHLGDLATLSVNGTLTRNELENSRFSLRVPRVPLAPIFERFVVEPYKHQNPFLTELRLEGFFSTDLELSVKDTLWTIKGRSLWEEGQATAKKQNIALKGIQLDLPIWYTGGKESAVGELPSLQAPGELRGNLFIHSIQIPFLPAQSIDTPLRVKPNRFETLSPIDIMTGGGQIEMGTILFKEPFSGKLDIKTLLTLEQIDLKPWLYGIWPTPLEGTADGKLDPVRWQADRLTTNGQVTADLFGGRLVLSNIGVKRFPSLTPVVTLDAVWTDFDLALITGGTAFGKVEGTLKGHVKGLEIADRQPQAFHLFMETVAKNDTPQKISVQAVDNIARIGGGASPFSGLTGAFLSLFKELPYEKIGISAVLENDMFRINGTIKEKGKEYMIKKGGFSGVDVIIGNPGSNTISFKDMVRRIKRVTESREDTVINE